MTWLSYKSKGAQAPQGSQIAQMATESLPEWESPKCRLQRNFGNCIIRKVLETEILLSVCLSKFFWKCQILRRKWHIFECLVQYFQSMRQSSNDKIWSPRLVLEAKGCNLAHKELILYPDRLTNVSISSYTLNSAVCWPWALLRQLTHS